MNNFLEMVKGGDPERIPFWFMRQAGRYLPEYRELRAGCDGFLDLVYSPDKACEATFQPLVRFGMDAAIIFSDILVIPHALGRDLEFVEGEGPKLNPLKRNDMFFSISPEIRGRLDPVYEAIFLTRETMKPRGFGNKALIGFCGGPWTLALYMVEGGGSKNDFMKSREFAYRHESAFSHLIEVLIKACTDHLIGQIEAGAECVQIFDSWAGLADAHNFDKWVIGPTCRIVQAVHEAHPDVPIIGFPRGAGEHYVKYVRETKVNVISLDHTVDPAIAARTLQPLVCVQGNLDPACLLAGGDALDFSAGKIISDLKNKAGGFVFNLGHGIHKDTPVGHVDRLIEIIGDQGWLR